jgi:hypothetical protein
MKRGNLSKPTPKSSFEVSGKTQTVYTPKHLQQQVPSVQPARGSSVAANSGTVKRETLTVGGRETTAYSLVAAGEQDTSILSVAVEQDLTCLAKHIPIPRVALERALERLDQNHGMPLMPSQIWSREDATSTTAQGESG